MDPAIEALQREREEKVKLIAEKRRQVEELKKKRIERAAERAAPKAGATGRRNSQLGRSVDSLVAEILGMDASAQPGTKRASPEAPLAELREERASAPVSSRERALNLSAECHIAAETVDPVDGDNNYDRGTQTDITGDVASGGATSSRLGKAAEAPSTVLSNKLKALRQKKPAEEKTTEATAQDAARKKDLTAEIKELSPEEKDRIMKHPDFHSFFERTTLLVERTLGQEQWDNTVDFKDEGVEAGAEETKEAMKHSADFTEERASTRPITDCRFSPHQPEMFLAAYGQKASPQLSDPDGCMLVWNLAMKTRPELTFTCPSAVLTAQFNRFDPKLLFGGTYAGGIVLWDTRAKSGPVLRTPLSGKGHSHPVQAMQQVGTQNATNLISTSNDGRLCVWSLATLKEPQETIDLKNEMKNRRDLAVMSLSFPENETNTLYVGAEDGSVCQVHIHGTKVGVTESYDGHEGPVSGIDMHPHQAGLDATFDLALSCSFDWSLKLWMVKQYQAPVLSLDSFEDYVFDAKWHPHHPAVFASVDGEGHVDLWNLNRNIESPIVRCESPNSGQKRLALNKCHWSTDGRRLVTGDSQGMLSVYSADRQYAQPRSEEFQQFSERVRQFKPVVARSRDGYSSGISRGVAYGDTRY